MSRPTWLSVFGTAFLLSACSGGGLQYWLYPEPHLPETQEAIFLAHEEHRVQYIGDERTDELCWGASREHQAYRQRKPMCRLHLRPGTHTLVVQTSGNTTVGEQRRLEFEAEAGKVYGIRKTGCLTGVRGQQNACRIEVIEVSDPAGFR